MCAFNVCCIKFNDRGKPDPYDTNVHHLKPWAYNAKGLLNTLWFDLWYLKIKVKWTIFLIFNA